MKPKLLKTLIYSILLLLLFTPKVSAQTNTDWYMAGANPQRTSWIDSTPENQTAISGNVKPEWYRPFDFYINNKIQPIVTNDMIYVATEKGLYALHTGDDPSYQAGDLAWVYPTELPLAHSPTVVNGVAYVGGHDNKLHALAAKPTLSSLPTDSTTGYKVNNQILWTFEADGGFDTSSLVMDGLVFAGNRDGYMYALDAQTGNLVWRYQTGGSVLFSSAYKDGDLYFGSNDGHAYAVTAANGSLKWKSAQLPTAGFYSYWPVVYGDWVIFVGSTPYRLGLEYAKDRFPEIGGKHLHQYEYYSYTGSLNTNTGTEPGDWAPGTVTMDASSISEHYENKPWMRSYFVLDRSSGQELRTDVDGDGNLEYAPLPWAGPKAGSRYPPLVGYDNVLYQHIPFVMPPDDPFYIAKGHIAGWKFGTQYLSLHSASNAVDEPLAYSSGGEYVYSTLTIDRTGGKIYVPAPYGTVGKSQGYWSYDGFALTNQLRDIFAQGYNDKYFYTPDDDRDYLISYGNTNGIYGLHGVISPFTPYKGKLYTTKGNSVLAFTEEANNIYYQSGKTIVASALPRLSSVDTTTSFDVSIEELRGRLQHEVQKMLDAGHLRPGYLVTADVDAHSLLWSDYYVDYFHNPADTLYTLTLAIPHLPADMQAATRTYIQQEYASYPPETTAHIGWNQGAKRESALTPPEIQSAMDSFGPRPDSTGVNSWNIGHWKFPPDTFYKMWKYAQEFGGASEVFSTLSGKLEVLPTDTTLIERPDVLNAYIAGHIGYLELEQIATGSQDAAVQAELDRLLALRVQNFSKDSYFTGRDYTRAFNVSRNFMFMVPELADHLRTQIPNELTAAISEYEQIAPAWFVTRYEAGFAEGNFEILYDSHSLFQAKAMILNEPYTELVKYLDVPAFERGDLFYIQNLVTTIEASDTTPTPPPSPGDTDSDGDVDIFDYNNLLTQFGQTGSGLTADFDGDSDVDIFDYNTLLTHFGS